MQNFDKDLQTTLSNREKLFSNSNLLDWYRALFSHQFEIANIQGNESVLEIGSGTSPIKMFHPNVLSSDILPLGYVDFQFDALEIDSAPTLNNKQFDHIILTNVLHHLEDPISFLKKASQKLSTNGKITFTEPYFSILSKPIYKYLHHEPSDFSISDPILSSTLGPLSGANMAIPHMVFFQRPDWLKELGGFYQLNQVSVGYFSGLSYFASGGISRRIPIPNWLYNIALRKDLALAKVIPNIYAAFFTVSMIAKKTK